MPHRIFHRATTLCVLGVALFSMQAYAHSVEVFAKAAASKNYNDQNSYTVSVTGAAGLAILLIPQVRIEARYTVVSSLQNQLSVGSPTVLATLNDIKTQTNIYSAGLDIDILSDKHAFQPFIFLGGGYIESSRSYFVTPAGSTTAYLVPEPKETGVSANVGAGFRIRIARSVAFEIEAYGYGVNIQNPNPLVNLFGNAGIRLFM